MTSFDFLWQLLEKHGVIPNKKEEALQLWNTFPLEKQRIIYRCIRDKLRQGKFVNYNPVIAIINNTPRAPKIQVLSFAEYYARYGTTEPRDGWKQANPTGNKVIYIKN